MTDTRSSPGSARLSPCPICAGTADEDNACQMAKVATHSFRSAIGGPAYRVECGCGTQGPARTTVFEAEAAWNVRAPAQAGKEPDEQLWGRFVNHYWDSFEGDKEIILKHVKAILDYHAENAGPPSPVAGEITDAMCEAAIDTEEAVVDRIQGFSYNTRHVIRDVRMPWAEQEVWSAPIAGADEYQAFQKRVQIERMRRVLAAALTLSSTNRNTP